MMTRISRLRQQMEANGESAFLVSEGKNRRYLSGFTGSSGWLTVGASRSILVTDGRYWDQVERQSPGLDLFRYLPAQHKSLTGALSVILIGELALPKGAVVGIELDEMPVALYRTVTAMLEDHGLVIRDVEGRTKDLRTRKDESELALLRRAAEIADAALSAALQRFAPGMTEASLRAEIDYQVLLRGGEGAAFPTIVASGINGSYPHAGASDKEVAAGELITIDFGAIWKGYCSDMTRTVWFGELSEHNSRLVAEVTSAHAKAIAAARPGLSSGDLDEVARTSLREAGLADFFIHSLGHGVGLDVHEAPTLRSGQTDLLQAGQVITIEPGVYLPGQTGCRVEDTIVLGSEGSEVINNHPKQRLDQTKPPGAN